MEAVFSLLSHALLFVFSAASQHCVLAAESTSDSVTESIFASATCLKGCIWLDVHTGKQGALRGHLTLLLDR